MCESIIVYMPSYSSSTVSPPRNQEGNVVWTFFFLLQTQIWSQSPQCKFDVFFLLLLLLFFWGYTIKSWKTKQNKTQKTWPCCPVFINEKRVRNLEDGSGRDGCWGVHTHVACLFLCWSGKLSATVIDLWSSLCCWQMSLNYWQSLWCVWHQRVEGGLRKGKIWTCGSLF